MNRIVLLVVSTLLLVQLCLCAPNKASMLIKRAQGACNDTQDLKSFHDNNATFHNAVVTCATKCALNPNPAPCDNQCLMSSLGLTAPCSDCWTADIACSNKNCFGPCLIPTSKECTQCSLQYCYQPLLACAGVCPDQLPSS